MTYLLMYEEKYNESMSSYQCYRLLFSVPLLKA